MGQRVFDAFFHGLLLALLRFGRRGFPGYERGIEGFLVDFEALGLGSLADDFDVLDIVALADGVDHLLSCHHLAEHRVLAVQVRGGRVGDEELAATTDRKSVV